MSSTGLSANIKRQLLEGRLVGGSADAEQRQLSIGFRAGDSGVGEQQSPAHKSSNSSNTVVVRTTPPVASSQKSNRFFSSAEIEAIKKGVSKHGTARGAFEGILLESPSVFVNRTAKSLRAKWRADSRSATVPPSSAGSAGSTGSRKRRKQERPVKRTSDGAIAVDFGGPPAAAAADAPAVSESRLRYMEEERLRVMKERDEANEQSQQLLAWTANVLTETVRLDNASKRRELQERCLELGDYYGNSFREGRAFERLEERENVSIARVSRLKAEHTEYRRKHLWQSGVQKRAPTYEEIAFLEYYRNELDIEKRNQKALSQKRYDLEIEARLHRMDLRVRDFEKRSKLKVGDQLGDFLVSNSVRRYALVRLVGKGGMSEVWKAYDLLARRDVVIKTHAFDHISNELQQEKFAQYANRETELLSKLDHRNVVSFVDTFRLHPNDSSRHDFASVLEFCDGLDLKKLVVKSGGFLYEKSARSYLLQIISGMVHYTKRRVIHHDLKPANVMVDSEGVVKITDFGMAKDADQEGFYQNTQIGAGTPKFLAPETYDRGKISSKVDVWALGVTYYYLLYGSNPYQVPHGADADRQAMRFASTSELKRLREGSLDFPDDPESKDPSAPKPVPISPLAKDFIRKCLTWDVFKRPSVGDLTKHPYVVDLKRWQTARP